MEYDNYTFELKEEEAIIAAIFTESALNVIYGIEPISERLYIFLMDILPRYNCYHLHDILTNRYEPIYPSTINENDIIPIPYNKKNLSHILIWKTKQGELTKNKVMKDITDKIDNEKIGCYKYSDSYKESYKLIVNENRVLIYVESEKRYYQLKINKK